MTGLNENTHIPEFSRIFSDLLVQIIRAEKSLEDEEVRKQMYASFMHRLMVGTSSNPENYERLIENFYLNEFEGNDKKWGYFRDIVWVFFDLYLIFRKLYDSNDKLVNKIKRIPCVDQYKN